MNATILLNNEEHYPVLLDEILSIISPQNGGTFIDCTLGQGGYTNAILKFNEANVIAIDRDPDIKLIARKIKLQNKNRFLFFNKKFSDIDKIQTKNYKIKAIIFDLGYSYTQIKDPKKGLSFESKGKLNMKLGLNSFSADEVINKLDQKDLELIFKYFGEEKDSKLISKKIVENRLKSKLNTEKLVDIINSVKSLITDKTKVIAIPHIISVYGTVMPIKEICAYARKKGIFTVIDGAQAVGQIDVDLKDLWNGILRKKKWLFLTAGIFFSGTVFFTFYARIFRPVFTNIIFWNNCKFTSKSLFLFFHIVIIFQG